jgi:TRAP-type C4-dicarboxylate transport system permease small subunit
MYALIAVASLALTVASLLAIPVGVVFAPFLFGLFLLALVGLLGGVDNRTVRQHDPQLDSERWRNGS